MTAKEYAELYAGREVKANVYDKFRLCRIVGYSVYEADPYVALEVLDDSGGIWEAGRNSSLCLTVDLYSIVHTCCWAKMEWIEMRAVDHKKAQLLYTNKCKVCYSPSRKCSSYTFCSNSKCKSRKKLNYLKANKPVKCIDKNGNRIIHCRVCLSKAVRQKYRIGATIEIICQNEHDIAWELEVGDVLDGEARKVFGYACESYRWDGNNWENI